MNYFLDTEFSERGGERPTIDLISIGLVGPNGRTFYAESSEFNEELCNPWVKENVLPKLGPKDKRMERSDIAFKVIKFVNEPLLGSRGRDKPQFWAYYASYDWVVFCWLFGAMVDLPSGFPMHCMDLQQWWVQLGKPDIKPPQKNYVEHNALADALWNKELYEELSFNAKNRDY